MMEEALQAYRDRVTKDVWKRLAWALGMQHLSEDTVYSVRGSLHTEDGSQVAEPVVVHMSGRMPLEPLTFRLNRAVSAGSLYVMLSSLEVADGPGYIIPIRGYWNCSAIDTLKIGITELAKMEFFNDYVSFGG